jgi:hypothetical protein
MVKRVQYVYRRHYEGSMRRLTEHIFRTAACYITTGVFAASTFAYAQDSSTTPSTDNQQQSSASTGGWRRVDDPPPQDQSAPQPNPNDASNQDNGATDPNQVAPAAPPENQPADQQQPNYDQQQQPNSNQPSYYIPAQLTIRQGTFVTVRVNQPLSSDTNQAGDAFSATLVRPLVVDGVVIAEPGQTIAGRVVEAKKAGHVEGVARLGVQLTDLALVDGQQVSIQSQLISRSGPTSVGRDAGAIAGTTALGAAIGAGADWGRGAAIGAGAGAVLATIGVLVTRGHPSVIYPEQVLTFRIEAPVTISTANSPQAFHFVQPNEYDQSYNQQQSRPNQYASVAPPPPPPYYGSYYGYPSPYYGYPYGYYGYPYYWGPGISFYFGPGYWWGGHYYRGYYGGRGFYGRGVYGGRGFEARGFAGRGFVGGGVNHGFSGGGTRGFSGGGHGSMGGGGAHGGGSRR